MKKILITFFSLFFSFALHSTGDINSICRKGNFALTAEQIPGPLISFGELIVTKDQKVLYLYGYDYMGKDQHFFDIDPGVLYGISDNLSVFFNAPIAATYKIDNAHSSGLRDITIEFEYALFRNIYSCSGEQMTIVANAAFPTGSIHKEIATGTGSMSYFLGTTYNHTWSTWFLYTSYGTEIHTPRHHRTQFGNQFLYQFGFGRNITTTKEWLFALQVEFDGTFSQHNKVHGIKDPNSGGNVIYVTPSLWAASKDWILQLGLGYAAQQHLFGEQNRLTYLLAFTLARIF